MRDASRANYPARSDFRDLTRSPTITSFFVPEKIPTATIHAGPVKMHLTPTAGAGAGGVGAFGSF